MQRGGQWGLREHQDLVWPRRQGPQPELSAQRQGRQKPAPELSTTSAAWASGPMPRQPQHQELRTLPLQAPPVWATRQLWSLPGPLTAQQGCVLPAGPCVCRIVGQAAAPQGMWKTEGQEPSDLKLRLSSPPSPTSVSQTLHLLPLFCQGPPPGGLSQPRCSDWGK